MNAVKKKKTLPGGAIKKFSEEHGIYYVLAGMIIVSMFLTESFTDKQNIINVARQISISSMVAFGAMVIIITGGIDLSAGSVMALAGVLGVMTYVRSSSLLLAALVSCVVGIGCGFINGFASTVLKVPSFIATMAMQQMARGAILLITNAVPIYQIGDLTRLGKGNFLSIPIPVWGMIGVAALTWFLLNRTRFGRYLYAIGGNQNAAITAGINVNKIVIFAHLYNSCIAGFAGLVLMARLNGGLPLAGEGYEFDAISSAVIGGVSLSGGTGTVSCTIAGALIMGILNNILNLLTVQSYLQQVIKGAVLVLAVAIDVAQKQRKEMKRKKSKGTEFA